MLERLVVPDICFKAEGATAPSLRHAAIFLVTLRPPGRLYSTEAANFSTPGALNCQTRRVKPVRTVNQTMNSFASSTAESTSMKRIARQVPALFATLLLTASLAAQERKPVDGAPRPERSLADGPARGERKPTDGAPRGERNPADSAPRGERKPDDGVPRGERAANPGAPRGERQPGAERGSGPGGSRAEFPAELKLTEEQHAMLKEINSTYGTRQAELSKKRESILTEEQRTAHAEAAKKLREGNLSREEAGKLMTEAVKLTPEQKSQIEAVDLEARQLNQESTTKKMAVLSDEQRGILRKQTIAANVARSFTIPGGITLTEDQKTSLLALNGELGGKLAELTEKQALIMTDERRTAREAAFKDARENSRDRQATADAVDAALKLTDAEKTQLAEVEQSLRELNQQIRERMAALLTPDQRAELEKRFGGRSRN